MATFFSNKRVGTWSGTAMYGTLTGNVGRSGNTVTLSSLTCSMSSTSAWGTDNNFWTRIYSGDTQLCNKTGLSMSGGSGSVSLPNASVTVSATATSHTFNLRTSDGYKVSFSVSFPAGTTPPATPTCSAAAQSASLINVAWGISNLGNPTGSVSLYNGTTNNPTNLLQTKTTTGSWTFGNDQRTANTTYYYKATASNSAGSASSSVVSATTYPAGVTSLTVDSVTSDSVTITAVYGASGNALTTDAGCRINGSGTWDTIDTDMQGTTQTYTLGPFLPETTNTVEIRVSTSVGSSPAASVTFTTPPPVKFYGSVNDQSELVKKMYGAAPSSIAVNSYYLGTEEIITSFNSADFEAYAIADYPDIIRKDVSGLRFDYDMSDQSITITALFKEGTSGQLYSGALLLGTVKATRLGCDGVADLISTPPSSDLTDTVTLDTTVSYATKIIKKLYGSVNGQTKLIYRG